MENTLNKIIKYALYSLVFFLPIFFLPLTVFPVAQNKQTLLAGFCFLIIILWAIKVFSSGKLSFVWNKLTLSIFLLLLVLGISTLFSGSKPQSFWGMSFEADTLFNFILYGLTFFIFANLISANQPKSASISDPKNEVFRVLSIFLGGSGVLAALFLVNSFFKIFPWDFAKSTGFNPIGTVQALSLFLAGAFLVLMALATNTRMRADRSTDLHRYLRSSVFKSVSICVLGLLLFATILLINYWLSWLGIIFGITLIIWSRLREIGASQPKSAGISDSLPPANPLKPLLPLLFILVLAVAFLFIKLPLGNILKLPSEISPTYNATFDISQKTLMEGPKNFILGSGPATFEFDYSLHRSVGPNLTPFWYLRFEQGVAALPTFLATFGILGMLTFLFLLVVFFWKGFKNLISINKPKSASINGVQLAAFIGGFYFLILWFFYPLNFTLTFCAFFLMGLFTAISVNQQNQRKSAAKEFSLAQSPQKSFFVMIGFSLLIVGAILGFYSLYQKYAGALNYEKGITAENLDKSIINLGRAVNLDGSKDFYFRNLSQVFLLKTNEILTNQELSQEQKQNLFQQAISNAEITANSAIQINPKDSFNWQQLGSVYENLIPLNVKGTDQMAIQNYQKAQTLDPQNPQFPYFLGRTYFAMNNLDEAKKNLEKSIELKADFTPATDLLKQISAD